jgi:hypothetical protein
MEGVIASFENIFEIKLFFLVNLTMGFNCLGYVAFNVMAKQETTTNCNKI